MKSLTKEQWLEEIPELIYKLKKDYGFYYSGFPVRITKDILEIIKNPKNKHKIVLYNKDQKFFVVVYRKNDSVIYYTTEYIKDQKWNRISYFTKKFKKFYDKAERELENDLFKSCSSQ